MRISYLVIAMLLASLLSVAPSTPWALAADEADTDQFAEEGLSDSDLTADLEAENLPTTNGFRFWWEEVRNNVVATFTFNAERKAAHYRTRLHALDRKLAACAEIGDEECVDKVETRMDALEDKTTDYIEKRKELAAEHAERFAAWRTKRQNRVTEHKELVKERMENRQELLEQRASNRADALERRRTRRLSPPNGDSVEIDRPRELRDRPTRTDAPRDGLRRVDPRPGRTTHTPPPNAVTPSAGDGLQRARDRAAARERQQRDFLRSLESPTETHEHAPGTPDHDHDDF